MQSQSPPLHHPVPQHPIQFPGAAPAPGAAGVTPQGYGYAGAAPASGQAGVAPGMPFMADPSAQLGIEVGRNAFSYGQRYLGQNMEQYTAKMSALRYYFQVSNSYVVRKLGLVLFPWRHTPWSRQIQREDPNGEQYAVPCDDINAPDMYIPIMAFTTYLVLYGVVQGLGGTFHPQLLGLVVSKSLAIVICELMFLKLFSYLLAASSSSVLDLFAYSGYKFVAITLTTLAGCVASSTVKWLVFAYTASATAFFMLRSLRYILLTESAPSTATVSSGSRRQQRIQFLFVYSVPVQFVLMWFLLPPTHAGVSGVPAPATDAIAGLA